MMLNTIMNVACVALQERYLVYLTTVNKMGPDLLKKSAKGDVDSLSPQQRIL